MGRASRLECGRISPGFGARGSLQSRWTTTRPALDVRSPCLSLHLRYDRWVSLAGTSPGSNPRRPRPQVGRHLPALLLWSVMACTGTTHTNSYGIAAVALGGAIVSTAVNRAMTGDCWARCRPGLICDRRSGECVPGECAPGCPVGQHCVRDGDGSTRCEDHVGAVTFRGPGADAGVAAPTAADAAAPVPSDDAAAPLPLADAAAHNAPSEADAAAAPSAAADATASPPTVADAGSQPQATPESAAAADPTDADQE